MTVELYLGDCLEYMKTMSDKSVDAIITDPPYGIADVWKGGAGHGWENSRQNTPKRNAWDKKPEKVIFDNIQRTGKRLIIWGGNYFELPISRGWLIWDKAVNGFSLSDAELAWTNIDMPIRIFRFCSSSVKGFAPKFKESRKFLSCHPTQKPLALMKWCVENYTNPNDTIFDPFMGSGTTGVACVQLGRNFIGCEIDPTYFEIAKKRIAEAELQPRLFQEVKPQEKQDALFKED